MTVAKPCSNRSHHRGGRHSGLDGKQALYYVTNDLAPLGVIR
jgi:hypothetical protein